MKKAKQNTIQEDRKHLINAAFEAMNKLTLDEQMKVRETLAHERLKEWLA